MERLPTNSHTTLPATQDGIVQDITKALSLPIVQSGLTIADKAILKAYVQPKIRDYQGNEAGTKLAQMLEFIKYDVGYTPKDKTEWNYQCVRIVQLVYTYYGDLTLEDFKTAFEMLIIGELDAYIPSAERKHYGQFTPEYVGKILKAYKKRQSKSVAAVFGAEAKAEKKAEYTDEQKAEGEKFIRDVCSVWYGTFTATGKLPTSQYDVTNHGVIAARCIAALGVSTKQKPDESRNYATYYQLVAQRLESAGLFSRREPTEDNRKKAYSEYIRLHSAGHKNDNEAAYVRRVGYNAKELDYVAQKYADLDEIRKSFSRLHEKGITNICDVI